MPWKFAFSTLGVPGAPLEEVLRLARHHGCDGLELRVHDQEFTHLELSDSGAQAVVEQVREAGLEIAALAGYAKVCSPAPDAAIVEEIRSLLRLAQLTGAEGVRLFPGGDDASEAAEHRDRALRRLQQVLPEAREAGVRLLVETHDSHPTGAQCLQLVQDLDDPQTAAVLWDGLHPWRSGEAPARTLQVLGEHFGYFQVKDAVPSTGDDGSMHWVPVLPGEGEVPLEEQGRLLQGFSGWISLEWERAWHRQIPPLAEALPVAARWFHRWSPS